MTQVTFTTRAEILDSETKDKFNVALVRLKGEKIIPLINLKGLSAADVYHKFEVKVDVPPPLPKDALAAAKVILRNGLDKLPSSQVISRDEAVDIFLDTLSALGYDGEE